MAQGKPDARFPRVSSDWMSVGHYKSPYWHVLFLGGLSTIQAPWVLTGQSYEIYACTVSPLPCSGHRPGKSAPISMLECLAMLLSGTIILRTISVPLFIINVDSQMLF